MNGSPARFREAFARFDAAHREDPRLVGQHPQATQWSLLYHQRLSHWVEQLDPAAPEPLRLAARCQHIRRWMIPRDKYPEGAAGYRSWRAELARFHAEQAGAVLRELGYDESTIGRVGDLLMKKRLKQDPEVQLFEDAICLVFLENELTDFAGKHDRDTLVRILRKTWAKMSPRGHEAATELVGHLPEALQRVVAEAVRGA